MKTCLALGLMALMLGGVVACGSDAPPAPSAATTASSDVDMAAPTKLAAPAAATEAVALDETRPSASCVDDVSAKVQDEQPAVKGEKPAVEGEQPAPAPANAYERALLVKLDEVAPLEETGLHNVFVLSDKIISGSEPHGEDAFAALREKGVKTILSVDGKAPDAELAKQYGMRYVHVPIEYSGLTDAEIRKIAKTFHELEGPFYVHCFHGKHRGPAAAAIGRIAVDGVGREQALAEMRQWCGTSKKYQGLYGDVAEKHVPTASESAEFDFDFPSQRILKGFRAVMIELPRANDNLLALAKRGWERDPEHPDIDLHNESVRLLRLFESEAVADELETEPEDFRKWIEDSIAASRVLERATARLKKGDASAKAEADAALDRIQVSCNACHKAYRD